MATSKFSITSVGCAADIFPINKSFDELKSELIKCSTDKERAFKYTMTFVNLFSLLQYLIQSIRDNKTMETSALGGTITLFSTFTVERFKLQTGAQVDEYISNLFALLNKMLTDDNIRPYLFVDPSKKLNDFSAYIQRLKIRYHEMLIKTIPGYNETYMAKYSKDNPEKYHNTNKLLQKDVPTILADQKILYDQLYADYVWFMENYMRSVRTYVRIKGGELTTPKKGASESKDVVELQRDSDSIRSINVKCGDRPKHFSSDSFAAVFDENQPTKIIYDLDLKHVLHASKEKRNIVVFGYGYSGSGKTYTLLQRDEGLIYQWLKDKDFASDTKTKLHAVFELYENIDAKKNSTIATIKGQIIKLNIKISRQWKIDIEDRFVEFSDMFPTADIVNPSVTNTSNMELTINNLYTLFGEIDNHRQAYGRITETKNNKTSSRSHLFLVFSVTHNTSTSYVTFVDMAGREDPVDIIKKEYEYHNFGVKPSKPTDERGLSFMTYLLGHDQKTNIPTNDKFFDKSYNTIFERYKDRYITKSIINTGKILKDSRDAEVLISKKSIIEPPKDNAVFRIFKEQDRISKIIREGLYINETMNHMKSYFLRDKFPFQIQPIPVIISEHVWTSQGTYNPDMVSQPPERIYQIEPLKQKIQLVTPAEDTKSDVYTYTYKPITRLNPLFIFMSPNFTHIQYQDDRQNVTIYGDTINRDVLSRVRSTSEIDITPYISNIVDSRKQYNKSLLENGMIPILKALSSLHSNIPKYVMLCCVRREKYYCGDTIKTLQFATDISSIKMDIASKLPVLKFEKTTSDIMAAVARGIRGK